MLRGESPQSLTTPTQVAATPAFDGRELRRWGIGEDRLQPGSVVLFREPTAWQRYRPQIIVGVTFASVQALFVIALLASLVKRRREERSLRVSEQSFRLLLNAAPVMIWSAGPDKQCTNVNRARLDFTGRISARHCSRCGLHPGGGHTLFSRPARLEGTHGRRRRGNNPPLLPCRGPVAQGNASNRCSRRRGL
jgi:PAS domain-containing protein